MDESAITYSRLISIVLHGRQKQQCDQGNAAFPAQQSEPKLSEGGFEKCYHGDAPERTFEFH